MFIKKFLSYDFSGKFKKSRISFPLEGILFFVLIALNFAVYLYLAASHRAIQGHDGFADFALDYYFLNSAVIHHEIPQWIPFLTHGTTALWFFIVQGVPGILTNVLFLAGPLLKGVNFLSIFYLEIFFDELVLLTGTWLLARKFFSSSYSVFFVASCVLFSSIAFTQIKFSLRIIYALPLIIYFLHALLDTGRWRYLLLAANLYFFQLVGNLAYFLPISSLTICSYFVFFVLANPDETVLAFKKLCFNRRFWVVVLFVLLNSLIFFAAYKIVGDQIAIHSTGRNPDGSVVLKTFLNYGGDMDMRKFRECFLRVSSKLDYTLYFGFLALTLATVSPFLGIHRKNRHFYFLIVFFLLLGTVSFVAGIFYFVWPFMKFYRHMSYVAVIAKYFLCFAAGFGFEAIFINRLSHLKRKSYIVTCLLLAVGLLIAWYGLHSFRQNYPLRFRISESALNAILFSAVFAVLPFIDFKRYGKLLVVVVLSVHIFDLYSYKVTEGIIRTLPLNANQYQLTTFQDFSYSPRRGVQGNSQNPRNIILEDAIQRRALYWTIDSFLFNDPLVSPYQTDFWQISYDKYLRAYYRQSLEDFSIPFAGFRDRHIEFPEHPAALKLSGVTENKIQFFSKSYFVDPDSKMASLMTDKAYRGDMLFLSKTNHEQNTYNVSELAPSMSLKTNDRLNLNYEVSQFTSNTLDIHVDVPLVENIWLFYSDVWHPNWKATINSREVPVFRANLAYKAIPLQKGENTIRFFFDSPAYSMLYFIFAINAASLILVLFILNVRICTGRRLVI